MNAFLVIDDHKIVRSGIKNVLLQLYPSWTVDEAENETEARLLLGKNQYRLIILDIHIPGTDSITLTQYIVAEFPLSPVLIFSMNFEMIYAKRFIRAGANGFISKNADTDELKKAIYLCLDNKRYVSKALSESLIDEIDDQHSHDPFGKLSSREMEIADLFIQGQTNTSISALLSLRMSSIGTYKQRIFTKLGVKNIIELAELKKLYES